MSFKCKILLAQPVVQDPMFANSAVFIFNHTEDGADGVILNGPEIGMVGVAELQEVINNRPESFAQLKDLLVNGSVKPIPLLRGGPCGTPGIYFVHGHKEFLTAVEPDHAHGYSIMEAGKPQAERLTVMDGIYFGTPLTFASILEANKVGEKKFRFFAGQACWGPGQLEQEVSVGGWKVIDATPDLFFNPEAINKLGRKRALSPFMAMLEPSLN